VSAGLADPVNDKQKEKYPSNPLTQVRERSPDLVFITYKKTMK